MKDVPGKRKLVGGRSSSQDEKIKIRIVPLTNSGRDTAVRVVTEIV
jgi:hypothetical protein